jgi:hypothetical protein
MKYQVGCVLYLKNERFYPTNQLVQELVDLKNFLKKEDRGIIYLFPYPI